MARKAKDVGETREISEQEMRRMVKEAVKQKQAASEYQSSVGGFIKNQIEKHGLERTAFNWTLKLATMEDMRKQEVLRNFLSYSLKAGHFDQMELFDDTVAVLEAIIATIRANANETKPADAHVDDLVH